MLEIFVLIALTKALMRKAAERGQSKGWAALGAVFWIGGEVSGIVLGALLGFDELGLYGMALGFAIVGAAVAWLIVGNLPAGQDGATAQYP